MGAPCGEETLLQVDPEWPAGGVCRVSDARPEVLDAAITITKSVEIDVLGASQVASKEAWQSLPIICQRMGRETSK